MIAMALIMLPVDMIYPHPDNPRKDLGDIGELTESIRTNGIYQNLTVVRGHYVGNDYVPYDGYMAVIGHRRLAAAKAAGLADVPCVVAEMDHQTQVQTMLLENMQRSDLTVYEQAQGFQMLLDFGASIDEIAEKSGFSKNTVRRRVKMMELDQEKLKEVSSRQLSLSDFDELAKIDDISKRNSVLQVIGTSDFAYRMRSVLSEQEINKYLPEAKKEMRRLGINSIKQADTWSSKYDRRGERISVALWPKEKAKIPKVNKSLFYCINNGWIDFYTASVRAKPTKRPQEDIDREKDIAAQWAYLDEQADICYQLRQEFIAKLECSEKNLSAVLKGALLAATLEALDYNSPDRETMCSLLQIGGYSDDRGMKVLRGIQEFPVKLYPRYVYAIFGDTAVLIGNSYRRVYPVFKPLPKLQLLYSWLEGLGYEMCSIEKSLVYGTNAKYQEWAEKRGGKQ